MIFMVDVFSKRKRSEIMSSVRHYDTKPELTVRKLLWKTGKRYRTHPSDVLGKPDIVHRGKKLAVFIDGCFWHGCKKCHSIPKSNNKFWRNKIEYNKKRRIKVKKGLTKEGWIIMEFWEHDAIKKPQYVADKIAEKL